MTWMLRNAIARWRTSRLGEWTAATVGLLLRRLAAASLLLALSGMAAAAGAGLTIAVARTPLSLPFYVAESQGYFSAEGVRVRLTEVKGGYLAMQQLNDKVTDLATASDSVIMFHSFKRNDFAVLASFVSGQDVALIAGKPLAQARPQQLAGKRIGVVVGSASHYYLDSWLVFHGVDPQTIQMIPLQPETIAPALKTGEVDAVAIWDPFAFEILNTEPGARLLPNPGIYTLSFNLIADKKLIGARDDELVRVLRALLRAERFIDAEPARAQAILSKRLDLKQDYIEWTWSKYQYRIALTPLLLSTLESLARWARREGHVSASRSPNYLDYIEGEPLRKAQPERMGIVK